MSKYSRYIVNISLIVAALATTLYLLMLGYYALPTADDWAWSRWVESMNPFGFVKHFYLTWQGRYSALLIDGALCRYLGWNEHLLGFTIVELLLGYGAVYLLLRDMLKLRNSWFLSIVTIIVTNLGIMAFPEIGTFYWLCTTNYIHEIWFTLYLVWFIFCCKTQWLRWSGALLCSAYIGGSAENYSPVVVLVLGCVWLYMAIRDKEWKVWKSPKQLLLLASAFVIGVGFLVMLFAPGNDVRMELEGSTSMIGNFSMSLFLKQTIKAFVILVLRLCSRGWYFICAFPLFMLIGSKTEMELPCISWTRVMVSLLVTLGVLSISVAGTVLGVGWFAAMRANCFITFVFMAWVSYVGVLFGYKLKEKENIVAISTTIGTFVIAATAVTYIVKEYPIVREYKQDVVAVHHQLQQYVAEGRTAAVYIKPIHIAHRQSSYGYLRNALQVVCHKQKRYYWPYFPYEPFQLEADPTNWRNQFYKTWLNAQFDIICTDETMDQ